MDSKAQDGSRTTGCGTEAEEQDVADNTSITFVVYSEMGDHAGVIAVTEAFVSDI